MNEEQIITSLGERFSFLSEHLSTPCEKRIFSDFLNPPEFCQVLDCLYNEFGFKRGHHVVGTDEGEDLGFIYIISNQDNIMFALKEKVPKAAPEIESCSSLYPCLVLHELELVDLFGAKISGLPNRPHYPLPDGWPEGNYPMRKEWKPEYFNKETMQYEPPVSSEEGGEQNG